MRTPHTNKYWSLAVDQCWALGSLILDGFGPTTLEFMAQFYSFLSAL